MNNAKIEKVGAKKWNLNNPADFKACLRTVLGENVRDEVIELYYHGFSTKNRELYDFMSKNVANNNDDTQIVLKVDVVEPEYAGQPKAES